MLIEIVTNSINNVFEDVLNLQSSSIEVGSIDDYLKKPANEMLVFVQIKGDNSFDFYLSLPTETVKEIVHHLFGKKTNPNTIESYQDAIKELANMIVGSVKKNLFEQLQSNMDITLPRIIEFISEEEFDFETDGSTLFICNTMLGKLNLIVIQRESCIF